MRKRGKRRHAHALRTRYGCFQLPKVVGARAVKEAKRDDVPWLARTDADRREVEFSSAWNQLLPEEKRYTVLHEQAHLKAGPDHNERFYGVLEALIERHHMPWRVAYRMESYNCHKKH